MSINNGSDLEKNFLVTLNKEDLMPLIEKSLRSAEPKKGLPGFRPGNTPLQMLYDGNRHQVIQESVRSIVSQRSEEFTGGKELFFPLSFNIDWKGVTESLDDMGDLDVTVDAVFTPDIGDIDWKSITVPSHIVTIGKEDIQKEIENRAKKSVSPTPLEKDRPAQVGDFLFYTTKNTGKDGKETVYERSLHLGAYALPKEFEDSLVGVSKGHKINEKILIPKNYPDKKLAGTKSRVEIVFHDIQEGVPCKPDESFAKASGFKSLEDMGKAVQKELEEYAKILSTISERRSLKKALLSALDFSPPPSSIKNVESQLKGLQSDGTKIDNEKIHHQAVEQVRIDCIVKKISKENSLGVKNDELMSYARQIAHQSGKTLDSVIAFWRSNPDHVDVIVQDILERKCLDIGLSLCLKEEERISFKEMTNMVDQPEVNAQSESIEDDALSSTNS